MFVFLNMICMGLFICILFMLFLFINLFVEKYVYNFEIIFRFDAYRVAINFVKFFFILNFLCILFIFN